MDMTVYGVLAGYYKDRHGYYPKDACCLEGKKRSEEA